MVDPALRKVLLEIASAGGAVEFPEHQPLFPDDILFAGVDAGALRWRNTDGAWGTHQGVALTALGWELAGVARPPGRLARALELLRRKAAPT